MFTTRKGLLVIILMVFVFPSLWDWYKKVKDHPQKITISQRAETHILYGDDRGGGHLHGTGKACKSEFPQNWNTQKIMSVITMMAANDNLTWKKLKNGYYVAEDMVEGTKVRLILDREKDDVVTAYPVNRERNPCPARMPANDNYND